MNELLFYINVEEPTKVLHNWVFPKLFDLTLLMSRLDNIFHPECEHNNINFFIWKGKDSNPVQ